MKNKLLLALLVISILGIGTGLRLYNINFGLPHSFHADEPEIVELAIKYTYEIRSIISQHDYYKLIPISYVYGTFPAYFYTGALMVFSKTANVLDQEFSKESLYVFLRVLNALLALGIGVGVWLLTYKVTKNSAIALVGLFLACLNWLYIVNAHYVNQDTILALLVILSFICAHEYLRSGPSRLVTLFLGVLLGLAAGTKITALVTLPTYLYLYLFKKDYRGLIVMLFVLFGTFVITNPFSIIFANDFVFRIYSMLFKEAGIVLDSIDMNPFKYISSLAYTVNPLVLILSLLGAGVALKEKKHQETHIFFWSNIFIYLIFYSLSLRRVDRWLLPIFPLIFLYASIAYQLVLVQSKPLARIIFSTVLIASTIYYPYILTKQYSRNTPKSEAYLWMQANTDPISSKLVITEEGLDPMNKLPHSSVVTFSVYESEGAFLSFPPDALLYDYVVLASRPMSNFKKPIANKKSPYYTQKWMEFEQIVLDGKKFHLIKNFVLPKPNLANLSDIYIYKRL